MKVSRRSFLASTAAASVPFILPSRIWSAATAPSNRLTMGFIGMGKQNGGLLNNFLRHDTRVLAVCDVDKTRRENAVKIVNEFYQGQSGENAGGCTGYSDFRELIARKDIDAVCIATPDHWHAIITLAALRPARTSTAKSP